MTTPKPEVVTFCGSTKFKNEFIAENRRLSLEGKIVISLGVFCHQEPDFDWGAHKGKLDDLHYRKIDLANRVHVIDVDGYIGPSTRKEIAYAVSRGIPVTYLSHGIEGIPK